jgi:hypothetical protein
VVGSQLRNTSVLAPIARPMPVVPGARRAGGVQQFPLCRCPSCPRVQTRPSCGRPVGRSRVPCGRPVRRTPVVPGESAGGCGSAQRPLCHRVLCRASLGAALGVFVGSWRPNNALQPTALSGRFSALACSPPPSRLCYPVLGGRRLSFPVGPLKPNLLWLTPTARQIACWRSEGFIFSFEHSNLYDAY